MSSTGLRSAMRLTSIDPSQTDSGVMVALTIPSSE